MFSKIINFLGFVVKTAVQGGDTALTLSDWANAHDPDGKPADIVEVIKQTNEIIEDMLWVESNQPTSHVSTIRTGYPSGTWRMFNYGVPQEKAKSVKITDGMGMLESYSEVDKSLASLNGNTASFRWQEDQGFIHGMSQSFAQTLFYGSQAEPEKFVGFANRYNGAIQDTDELLNTFNIIDGAGATSTMTSIYLVVWGANTCHGIFPKGSTAGLQSDDLGEDTLLDENGNKYQGYRTHYKWDSGLVVRDWRYVVRIANIDTAALKTDSASGPKLFELMVTASERIPTLGMGKPVFYVNRKIREFLRHQIINKTSSTLTWENVAGKRVMMYDGIPVRRCDALLNTETEVASAA